MQIQPSDAQHLTSPKSGASSYSDRPAHAADEFLIVIVSLKNIQADPGFTAAGLSWVPNAFGLAFGRLLGGRLGDVIGQVKAFEVGLAVFMLASLVRGVAPSPAVLVLARVVQGIGAAVTAPSGGNPKTLSK